MIKTSLIKFYMYSKLYKYNFKTQYYQQNSFCLEVSNNEFDYNIYRIKNCSVYSLFIFRNNYNNGTFNDFFIVIIVNIIFLLSIDVSAVNDS